MIQVNRIYLIFNRLVTKKFLVDTSDFQFNVYPPSINKDEPVIHFVASESK